MRIGLLVAALLITTDTLTAQSSAGRLVWDVVSIRRNTTESTSGGGGPRPGGRYLLRNMRPRALISIAYDLPSNRVLGGPGWLDTDRYDLEALGRENPTREETREMLRAVLGDRFRLATHTEKRELPVYALVVARPDGRLGPGLRRTSTDCRDPEVRKKAYASAPAGSRLVCGFTESPGTFTGGGEEMSTLAFILTSAAGRPVLDRTGLTGGFDIDLKWTPALQPDTADAVSIFTAVQEQLGLKLESTTAPLDVLVIDRIERPSEN
jgi:uncharacterized protein (TIGR03435 family)